jgi:hypothetical protein
VRTIVVHQVALAALILGLCFAFIPSLGVNGVGVAFLIGQSAVGLSLLVTELVPAIRRGGRR